VSQTSFAVSQIIRQRNEAGLHPARVLRGKHDHLAVGERVYMVFDATIRPTGRVGLEPGARLKRSTRMSEWQQRSAGIVYAGRAVVLQWFLGRGGWAKALAVSF
jgi:hypothetical protein